MTKDPRVDVPTGPERRRRWSVDVKIRLVKELNPAGTVGFARSEKSRHSAKPTLLMETSYGQGKP
jgi:hypothetical protein